MTVKQHDVLIIEGVEWTVIFANENEICIHNVAGEVRSIFRKERKQ